jgi:RimJ/RimL family protein N-acetyltransferase
MPDNVAAAAAPDRSLCLFPLAALPDAWKWLNEFPARNFDDYGATSLAEFTAAMEQRAITETIVGVLEAGELVGIMAYLPLSPRSGALHGVCFAKRVHGTGIAAWGLRTLLSELFRGGIEKVSASYFADNGRVRSFLAKCGAVDEGLLKAQTLRNGKAIDMWLVAFFKGGK